MGPIELVSAPAAFPARLAAWSDPTFVGRSIGSGRRLDAPSGLIELDTPERRGPTVVSRSLAQPMDLAARPEPVGARTTTAAPDEAAVVDESAGTATDVAEVELIPDAAPMPAAAGGTEGPVPREMTEPPAPSVQSASVVLPDGPAHTGSVRRTAQRIDGGVAPVASGASHASETTGGVSASVPVQRTSRPASAPALRVAPSRPESGSPVVPRGPLPGPADERAQSSSAPESVAEIASERLTAEAAAAADRSSSTLPVLQRAGLHPVSEGDARATRGRDPVEATEVPFRQSSPRAGAEVTGAVAPGVLQRATALPRAVPSVDPESPRLRAVAPAAAVLPTRGGQARDPREAPEPAETWSVLPPATPQASAPEASATVVELQRATLEGDSAPSATERWLRRAPVSIGSAAAGEPGVARHQTSQRTWVGEPSVQRDSAAVRQLPVARAWPQQDTGSPAVPMQLARPTGRVGSPVQGDDTVLQRAGADPAEPAAAPPEPVAVAAQPAGGAPAPSAAAGAPAAPHQVPASREDLDRLAASLMPALLWRIKAELVTERERRGVRSDRF